ncbi:NADH-ubiquinone oxidoreductase chain G [Patulibacter medicamentivorans]|uniref:NADH-quinone oxidoreductase n=1 Tax=Patulibacter medicamentivorans TaxID=1097667 RepID=H0E145_9ACTN|nr:NADH-quinone oxidoreductase subunit NuoG [Patulibacter medicamentivorans]EHN12620.1 NADH-ubiquinone oxidoreductase chain G [Patulibacter medicamentivorans]
MPRPEINEITFVVDGREVVAPAGTMLADAAKLGDVDIPVFCYEPKLGQPVGACRMCLVEVEGIPKLQTACSTPVRDGMVVNTETPRVKAAQESVVEFLLLNHPLDCPVCDKGGECPLQDISYGWGRGTSRTVEPKRHFEKPVELSPLIAIDRERCILCYRCVRFSQEVSEDYQLILHERGADTFVGTFDGHPYVAPFSGNIIELCPVGALTSQAYRFRARPWDIEQSGSVCTLCPGQCNVSYTVRDDRVMRVLSRQNDAVDDGWLCDRGRFAYQSSYVDDRVTEPLLRDGGVLRPVSWERALAEAARLLGKTPAGLGALAGGATSNEEGWLLRRLHADVLGSRDFDSRSGASGPAVSAGLLAALDTPEAQATVPDVEWAHSVLVLDSEPVDDMPILDLRIRKGVRRHGMRLAVATSRPSSLDSIAEQAVRFAPGAGEAFVCALDAAVGGIGDVAGLAAAAGADAAQVEALGRMLREAGEDVVIVWGERLTHGANPDNAARALLKVAGRLSLLDDHAGAGLLQVPSGANGRGLREIGLLPTAGPGYREPAAVGRSAQEIAQATIAGQITGLHLLHVDPVQSFPERGLWEQALHAGAVVAHAQFLTDGLREHANVVFPAEAGAEKEGTVTHPDGRLQRLRPAVARPDGARPTWQVLSQLIAAVGGQATALTSMMVTSEIAEAVPFYAGITHDEIGGFGVRWQEREAAAAFPAGETGPFALEDPRPAASPNGALRLGRFRSVWASPEVAHAPALKFLAPKQRAELNPDDAQERGIRHGQQVTVTATGEDGSAETIAAVAHLRAAAPRGSVFLESGLGAESVDVLDAALVHVNSDPARPA